MTRKEYIKEVGRWKRWKRAIDSYNKAEMKWWKANPNATAEEYNTFMYKMKYTEIYWGPTTIIRDPGDLLNPQFILPGEDKPFLSLNTSGEKIPLSFGKTVVQEFGTTLLLDHVEGKLVGFAYNASDYYLVVRDKDGEERYIPDSSIWEIKEEGD